LVALGLAVLAVLGLTRHARQQGAEDAEARRNAATLDRISAGQKAGAKAAASGKTSEEILRDNDGSWQ
jgi:hypothetical protein